MKTKFKLIGLLFITLIYTSCKKEKLDNSSVFVDTQTEKNALDKYIYNNLTVPYNVDILYKYIDRESDLKYNLVPASYDGSVRMTKLLLYLGLQPYDDVTGSKELIKKYFPKILNYAGRSPIVNNGTRILGTAEGGKKINLYNLNDLPAKSTNITFLNDEFFHTIHHEFAHILHQTKPYPASFNQISGTNYVNDAWNAIYTSTGAAVANGFISPYSSKSSDEDFVEIFSFYVTLSATDFNSRLNSAGSTNDGRAIIATKLGIVKAYMNREYKIDMDLLRVNILNKQANLGTFDQTSLN